MTISPEELFLTNGKTFEVSFALDRSIPVWGVLAAVNYDTDLLELAGYEVGGVFTESQFTFQEDTAQPPTNSWPPWIPWTPPMPRTPSSLCSSR